MSPDRKNPSADEQPDTSADDVLSLDDEDLAVEDGADDVRGGGKTASGQAACGLRPTDVRHPGV